MDEPTFRAALVGDSRSGEFSLVRPIITRKLPAWEVREYEGLTQLLAPGSTDGFFPDLVMVCQSWRDEYSADQVRAGLANFPVSRWICVYGAWCESEGRHGSHWPMAVRVTMSALETRLAHEAAVVQGRIPALPLTAARDEVFEFDAQSRFPKPAGPGIWVAIHGPDRAWRTCLSDLCRQAGIGVFEDRNTSAPLHIVDLDPFTPAMRSSLGQLQQREPSAKILGLKGLVFPEDRRELQAEGVQAVLSKLTPVGQILDTILMLGQGQQQGE
jgi:hypothetical protein